MMIIRVGVLLGNIWMSPLTILSAFYLGIFRVLGWVRYGGTGRWSIRLTVVEGSWLDRHMGYWAGWASGPFVVLRADHEHHARTIVHEDRHVVQQMIFGIFQPILYVACSVFIWIFYRELHSYYDNPFERDARRAAGQPVCIPRYLWADPSDRWAWWMILIVAGVLPVMWL